MRGASIGAYEDHRDQFLPLFPTAVAERAESVLRGGPINSARRHRAQRHSERFHNLTESVPDAPIKEEEIEPPSPVAVGVKCSKFA